MFQLHFIASSLICSIVPQYWPGGERLGAQGALGVEEPEKVLSSTEGR